MHDSLQTVYNGYVVSFFHNTYRHISISEGSAGLLCHLPWHKCPMVQCSGRYETYYILGMDDTVLCMRCFMTSDIVLNLSFYMQLTMKWQNCSRISVRNFHALTSVNALQQDLQVNRVAYTIPSHCTLCSHHFCLNIHWTWPLTLCDHCIKSLTDCTRPASIRGMMKAVVQECCV